MADVPSKKLRRGTSRLFTGSLRGSFAGEVPRRTGILTTEELLIDACKSVAYLLDSEASESQELEDGSEVGEETRDAAAMKVYPQVSQVWRGLCSYLAQELSLGRNVSIANLGVFYSHEGPPRQAGFKLSEKILKDHKEIHWEGPAADLGPITKAKFEKIADSIGMPKAKAEDVLQALVREMTAMLPLYPEISIEFAGIGHLKVRKHVAYFEPLALDIPVRIPQGPTAGHTMFGSAGTQLLKKAMSSTLLKAPGALPKLEMGGVPGEASPEFTTGWQGEGLHLKGLASGLGKSSSTPALAKHHADSGALHPEHTAPRRPDLHVPLPPSLTMRRVPSGFLGTLPKQDAESLHRSLTRQLPVADQLFPPLLDRCSRMRSALFREEVECDHVSNVVASNYSMLASSLTIDHAASDAAGTGTLVRYKRSRTEKKEQTANDGRAVDVRAVDWTAEWPVIVEDSPVAAEIESVGLSPGSFCRVLSRYRYYTEGGVPSEVLAPYNRQWLDHAVFLLDLQNPARWPNLPEDQQSKVIEEVRQEILKGYIRSVKTAVVNYALLNSRCRERLDIPFVPVPPPEWGRLTFTVPDIGTAGGPPEAWRAGLSLARASLLAKNVQNSQTALRLKDFWIDNCKDVILLSCPSKHSEVRDINAFAAQQGTTLENGLRQLQDAWQQVVQVVSEEPVYLVTSAVTPGGSSSSATYSGRRESKASTSGAAAGGSTHHGGTGFFGSSHEQMEAYFFQASAALLSLMAREVVEQTLRAYVEFFERFAAEPLHHEAVKALKDSDTWQDDVLVNKLMVGPKGTDIRFKHDLDQVCARLLLPYKDCTVSLKEFLRPDAKLREVVTGRQLLWEVKEDEDHIKAGYLRIEQIVRINLANAEKVLELYKPFLFLLDEEERVSSFLEEPAKTREDFSAYVQHLQDTVAKLNEQCPNLLRMQMMRVDCLDVNKKLVQCSQECVAKLLRSLSTRNQDRNGRLVKQFEHLNARITRQPNNEDQLVELEVAIENAASTEMPKLVNEYNDIKEWLYLTWDLDHMLEDDDYKAIYAASEWKNYATKIADRDNELKEDRMRIEGKLVERRTHFQDELTGLVNKVGKFKDKGSVRMLEDYLEQLNEIKKQLAAAMVNMEDINAKELHVGWDITEFESYQEAQTALEPFDKLWTLVAEHQKANTKWIRTPLFSGEIKPEEVEAEVSAMWRLSFKLKAQFEQDNLSKPANVAAKVKTDLDQFKENVPLLHALCNPGLRDRHWKEISNVVGFALEPDPSFTLQKVLDMDIGTYVAEIGEISESAAKEYQIESGLEGQIKEWEPIRMEFKDWGTTGTYIVAGASVDEVQTLLDDHVIKTQTMKGSPYAVNFAARLEEWEGFLSTVQDVIDIWLKVQGVWLYLEPIFSSEDIMQQMPTEGRLFREVDGTWREIMQKSIDNPAALTVFKQDNFLANLNSANEKLETVQKGLNDYLETKRLYFPRFFFLSNDNLLEILSETKDPKRVNAHIKKAFEGIQSLAFEADSKISGMISPEKELVPMTTWVDPVAARGAVEVWLVQVENAMIESFRDQIFQSKDDYPLTPFVDWVQRWAGQVVIGIFNLYWTKEVNEALTNEGNPGMHRYGDKLVEVLGEIVGLVRTEIGKLVRCTLEALIVIFVHNKDTILELRDRGTSRIDDFDWLVQLRYFIEENPDVQGQDDLCVRITNSFLGYAYESLGNGGRLVITPLTDRCYRTCCGALHLLYGAAPEGPAGTGKTESVKDLAKALARFCVVFNCSDELTVDAMAKFFKGLAASGGWACFDEFNRIDAEVLSVVAQQVLQIQNAIKAKMTIFEFEGTTLPIKWTCNCFITMNPGYAGRADLPDNLKALFRTVAMMVPDYGMIAEIKLYSYGYEDARPLSNKIVTTYKLCSEQLSSQKHYDYGMRAVFSVLVAAGNLKRKYPFEKEDILMLRSICDVNLAKFLAFDVPLFKGITSDLFPGVVLPAPDFGALTAKLEYHLKLENCQPHPYFIEKIIQFYECHTVRHSVMLVGAPFSGKTTALSALQKTLTDLANEGVMHKGEIVHQARLNPKSIPASCLYGSFDEVSKEWADGIVAVLFRDFGRNQTDERKWLVFDGPIDAVWIENMNTVMDENKKLCLNSGEIIAMSSNMRTIMEPMDVAEASPATISRNGMVFFEPHLMGIEPLVEKNFLSLMPESFEEDEINEVRGMTKWLMKPLLVFLRDECYEVSPTQDQNLVQSFMYLLMSHLKDSLKHDMFKKVEGSEAISKKNTILMIDAIVIFSLIWSVGAVVTTAGRSNFSAFFKLMLQGKAPNEVPVFKKVIPEFPERGSIYDYVFNLQELKWSNWNDTVEPQVIKPGTNVESLVIQTVDNIRYRYLLNHCIKHRIKLLFCGPTGTGKTAYMTQSLMALEKDSYTQIMMGFSAQTKCAQTQDLIDAKLDRRRKGVYGPPPGKLCILMVDDLNMPNKETYGAQPPIEILRQMIDAKAYPESGGWYERKDSSHPFRSIMDVLLFAAMGPPGGGRTFITPRILGMQYLVGFPLLDDDNMKMIFSTILDFKFQSDNYSDEVVSISKKIVNGTLEMYKLAVAELLPTPLKVHYTFNLRDFGKIIFGVLLLKKGECDGIGRHVRLWVHEVWRVIGDRLVEHQDRQWMLDQIRVITKNVFAVGFDETFKHLDMDMDGKLTMDELRTLIFGDMFSQPAAPNRPYNECPDLLGLQKVVEGHLEQYNLMSTKKMDLVCFLYMIEHLARAARIIKAGGNALLVGVGGSGRQSCARLACFLADFDVFQIEITRGYDGAAFREDLKKLLTASGGKGEKTVFLFSDSQIKSEGFVEDLNNLLNSGEVPNIFPADEKVQICEMVRSAARQEGKATEGTPTQLYGYFVERCRKMLAVVLCFSPIGDAWRARIRQFPSLVNCCTIDWYTEWPEDALTAVAQRFLGEVEMEEIVRQGCIDMCSIFHAETRILAVDFKNTLKRIYYATPTSFLELIQTFKTLLAAKRRQVIDLKLKYETGLEKILTTEGSVEGMKIELINLQPKLVEKTTEVEAMVVVVTGESEKTAVVKDRVSKEEEAASTVAASSEAQKASVEADLEEAMPALQEALGALDTLSSKDIGEIKAMKNPPAPVKIVLHAVCIMKGIKGVRVKNEAGAMVEDFWGPSIKMVSESDFLKSLQTFDKDNIPASVVKKIKADFISLDDFQPARVKSCSQAAWGLCMWVRAMETYDRVAKVVGPKKEMLAIAIKEYEEVMAALNITRAELQKVLDQLAELESTLSGLKAELDDLAYQVDLCQKKLGRAEQLMESLGGEKTRWTQNAIDLGEEYINLTGDVIVASGMIAYLGAFTPDFRERAVKNWASLSKAKNIPGSETITLAHCLGEPVKIRNWTICGLPNDNSSIENGVIIDKARRWPLCIDPQGQANKWIKKMETPNKLRVSKFSDNDYIRRLEGSISFGNPMLIENILEDTDPAIEPILLKQTFKKGNQVMLKLGEALLEYNKDFKFYLTTKLRNPHYLPEVAVKVTLLNFMITIVGLQDQILNSVVQAERPELAEEKARLVVEGAENKAALEDTETKILHVLQTSQGNILEDESAINVLSASKVLANKIAAKQEIAEETEKQIDEARLGYVPVAFKTSILFFCIADLANIDPMYQYSLPFFVNLFLNAIEKSAKSDDLEIRIANLNDTFRYMLYCNICRSLFEKHKTLFSFLLCIRGLLASNDADYDDYRFLLTGGVSLEDPPPKPADWVPDRCWGELFRMSKAKPAYDGFHEKFAQELDIWKQVYDDNYPMRIMKNEDTRPKMLQGCEEFQDLMVLRCIRPDRVVPATLEFISAQMGEKFVNPPPFDLSGSYTDSNCLSPLIFILSPGADPGTALFKFASEKNKEIAAISLGQGQGPKAEKLMDAAQKDGGWVLLQNCHLATSWMPRLDRILDEQDPKKINKDFRLWLTSYPSDKFPVAILQNGVKMTNEAPKGLRANMTGSYYTDPINNEEFFEACTCERAFKHLVFNLCFFHAVIQERRLFGPLGWNIAYEFTESDLRISAKQLQMFLDEYPNETPIQALNYLTGECNYGGRVTEGMDRRLLTTLLSHYYSKDALAEEFIIFEQDGVKYTTPPPGGIDAHLEHISSFPLITPPGVFGFHENANLTKEMGETYNMMRELLLTAGAGGGGAGTSPDAVVGDIARDVLIRLPDQWNLVKIQDAYPTMYEESMNTVLLQELQRFNGLISVIQSSLKDIQKAVKGLLLMSNDLEKAFFEIFDGTTPALWLKHSYPSLKPLGGYVNDLIERLKFFQTWVDHGAPVNFWFSGIYFQQAFTTGASQNFARRYAIPIDTLSFDFFYPKEQEPTEKPTDGVYTYGLYFEACKWDWEAWEIAESDPKVLFCPVPLIHLMPCEKVKIREYSSYDCPCYKVSTRKGILSTTGHSTNFVMPIKIPSTVSTDHWIKRGVAMLTTLDT